MNSKQTKFYLPKTSAEIKGKAKTGVSLHCHTQYSKEMLDFIPHYAEKLPVISYFWKKEQKRFLEDKDHKIDFKDAFWQPPMSENQVFDIESSQINNMELDAVVSITDHDSIKANLKLNESRPTNVAPISLEWTVPYSFGFFHVGVHNLPKDRAEEITKTLLDYTFSDSPKTKEQLDELFAMLAEIKDLLIVLNHPLWDIELAGKVKHRELLDAFLIDHGKWIHAFEINGFRSWSENKGVVELAETLGIPLVTGGDRHGCQPNTVINLTNAATFSEFAEEVRIGKKTDVLIMPEYKAPLHSRQMQSFSEILKYYPENPSGAQRWFERVHYNLMDGKGVRPVSDHMTRGGPPWLRSAIWFLGFIGQPRLRPLFKMFVKKQDKVPQHINGTIVSIVPAQNSHVETETVNVSIPAAQPQK